MRLVVSTIAICCLLATTTKAVNNVVVINNPVVRWALEHEEDTGKSPIYDSEDTDNEILPPMNEFLWDKVPFTSGLYGFKLANTGDYDVYGQVGLSISKWIFRDENTAIASAYYTNDYFGGATLKCSRDKKQNEHDERILRQIQLAKNSNNILAQGSKWVSQLLHDFWVGDYYCMVTSRQDLFSFRTFFTRISDEKKVKVLPECYKMLVQAVAFLHYAGVAHNNINPDTIRFYKNGESSQLMLTNYTKATIIKMNTATKVPIPQVPPTTSMGYEAPESMVIPKINVKKRDSWMTALMAYFACAGLPPHGFVHNGRELQMQSPSEYEKQLGGIYYEYKGKNVALKMHETIWLCMNHIGSYVFKMLTVDPKYRAIPQEIAKGLLSTSI